MNVRSLALAPWLLALALAACGDDDKDKPGLSSFDAAVQGVDATVVAPTTPDAGASDASVPTTGPTTPTGPVVTAPTPPAPSATDVFLVATNISTADESTLLVMTGNTLTNAAIDPKKALQVPGGGSVAALGEYYYVGETEQQIIQRYTFANGAFVKGPSVSYLGAGIEWFPSYFDVASADRAYIVSSDQLKIFEWNPTTMTQTRTHDISAFKREGWGQEFRGQFYRKSDGKLFLYWAYTNDRKDFINDFVLGVFDTKTNTLKIISDTSCPSTAGFGGYFDEKEDLYLFADSFGLFTKFGGFKEPKDACVLRIKKGEDAFDPSYKVRPSQALGGREPWGLYYLGNGVAYTTAVDPARINEYASVFELIFAPVHSGYLVDLNKNSATELTSIPKTGVGFESFNLDGRLLVPRSAGKVKIFDIEASEATVYDIKADASATPLFGLPGSVTKIARVR